MEKIDYSKHVKLTEGEYLYLKEKFGEVKLKQKIRALTSEKEAGDKLHLISDYHSLLSNGMQFVEPIRDKKKIEEMKSVLKGYSERDWFLFIVGINTGLRISDLLKLQVSDMKNKSHIIIKEQKTSKLKKFLINRDLKQHFDSYAQNMYDKDYLYPSIRTGLPIKRVQAYKILRKASEEVGLEHFGTHSLRKTFGYWHYQTYKDVALLQKIFNHATPEVTLRYIGINQDIVDKSLEDFSL